MGMRVRIVCLFLFAFLFAIGLFALGYVVRGQVFLVSAGDYTAMNQHQAIEFVEHCIASHQQYIDHPEWCDNKSGSVTFHQQVNKDYQSLLEYLRKK